MQPDGVKLDVLGVEGSTPAPRESQATTEDGRGGQPISIELDVVSDVICPWCYVGKRRLERALPLLGPGARVNVTWRPFQLNPSMPPGGIDRAAYRRAKFGSLERSAALDARLAAVGAAEGIAFRFDRIARTPNTLDAHRLIRLAGQVGVQDAVVERLFRAYFEEGVDVGDRQKLVEIGVKSGIDATAANELLVADEGAQDVMTEEAEFKALGIDGVPSFVVGGVILLSGAAEPQVIADALTQCVRYERAAANEAGRFVWVNEAVHEKSNAKDETSNSRLNAPPPPPQAEKKESKNVTEGAAPNFTLDAAEWPNAPR